MAHSRLDLPSKEGNDRSSRWHREEIGNLLNLFSGGTPSRSRPEFFGGSIPWIKSGELNRRYIDVTEENLTDLGLANSSAKLVEPGTVLLALYGATAGVVGVARIRAAINQAILALVPKDRRVNERYLLYALEFLVPQLIEKLQGAQPNLSAEIVRKAMLPVPMLDEQLVLADLFKLCDQSIDLLSRLRIAKEQRRQWLLSGLIPSAYLQRKASQYPVVPLSSVTREATSRNNGMFDGRALMAVTKAEGMVPMREHVRGKSLDRCLVVEPGAFAYNPMRLNIGSIAQWQGRSPAIVSPDYVVFGCDPLKLDPDYARYLIATSHWRRFVQRAGDGSVRVRIYYDTLRSFRLVLPPLQEQRRIAAILSACDLELDLHRRELELLKQQKRGLMQGLFTGMLPLPESVNGRSAIAAGASPVLLPAK